MYILAYISLVLVDSLVIVDNLPLTDESTITRGDCTSSSTNFQISTLLTCREKADISKLLKDEAF